MARAVKTATDMVRLRLSIIAASVALATPAFALQPLSEFLAAARRTNVDDREAALFAIEQREEALARLGQNLPSLSARVSYTRNQFESVIQLPPMAGAEPQSITIVPRDQIDGFLQADVPIIDVAAWSRTRAARQSARAALANARATLLDVEKQVARNYYQLIGADALRRSGEQSLAASKANYDLTSERHRAGVATQLDVKRAVAEVERRRQDIADAELAVELARRALTSLSGIAPEGGTPEQLDDLHEEPPLAQWEEQWLPSLEAAAEQRRSAETNALAAKLALVPSISAGFVEHFTNTTSFLGKNAVYTLTLNATWRFDLTTIANIRSQSANAQIAAVREERTRLAARDQIHDAWQRVRTNIVKSRSAREQAKAAHLAADFAGQRYRSGTSPQIEVIDAQRDAFAADVARIQADSDLSYTRALLRLDAGQPLDPEHDR
jgi:outer membrane protein TolC